MIKYDFVFTSLSTMKQAKKNFFDTFEHQNNILLIGQNPSTFTLNFISNYLLKYNNICSTYPLLNLANLKIDKEYKQNNWNFLKDEKILFKIYKGIILSFKQFIKHNNYWTTSYDIQNNNIQSLFNSLVSTHHLGITHGYLSLLSNLNYFISQLDAIFSKDEAQKVKNKIYNISDFEYNTIFTKPKVDFYFMNLLIDIYKNLENHWDLINIEALPSPDNFFDNFYDMKYSDFHNCFFTNKLLLKNYKKNSFYLYRFMMLIFLRMLPLLNISLIRRNHILTLDVLNIETFYHIDWKSQYYESNFIGEQEAKNDIS